MIIFADYIPSVFQRQKRFNVQPLYFMCTLKMINCYKESIRRKFKLQVSKYCMYIYRKFLTGIVYKSGAHQPKGKIQNAAFFI